METDDLDNDMTIERIIATKFGLELVIDRVLGRNVLANRSSKGIIFLTDKNQLFIYLKSDQKLVLADIDKILNNMNLVPLTHFPPAGDLDYFVNVALAHFKKIFPSKKVTSDDDLRFYKTLAPYNPALVQIKRINGGTIRSFDPDVKGGWRTFKKFDYRRIDYKDLSDFSL